MKKLVLMFVAVAAISFASCGNGTKAEAPAEDTTTVNDSTVADDSTAAGDSTVEAAPTEAAPADSAK